MESYARFWKLYWKIGFREDMKPSLVRQFTQNRTESLREMTPQEYDNLCKSLEHSLGEDKKREIAQIEMKRWRSSALHLMQKLGLDTSDWQVVDSFCSQPKIAGKKFRQLTQDDLMKLVRQLRAIQKSGWNRQDTPHANVIQFTPRQ